MPWRTTLLVALQLSIILRTFDAYLKWALPILFIAGPVFAYVRERRATQLRGRAAIGSRARPTRAGRPGRAAIRIVASSKADALRGIGAR